MEMNPTAAEIENGVPVSFSAQIPPMQAATTLTITSMASFSELNAVYRRMMISVIDSGTIHMSRLLAFSICSNSPDHSTLYPSVSRAPVLGSFTRAWASLIAEARSRPSTLNLMGMNRRLFSR